MLWSIGLCLSLYVLPGIISASSAVPSSTGNYIIELGNFTDADSSKLFGQPSTPTPVNGNVQLFSYGHSTASSKNSSVQLLNSVSFGDFRAVTVSAQSLNALTTLMKDHPNVLSIVPDVELTFDLPKPKYIGRGFGKRSVTRRSQSNMHQNQTSKQNAVASAKSSALHANYYIRQGGAPWNLLRISEHSIGQTRSYGYRKTAGAGVTVFVIDDGIDTKHPDFEGRAKFGWTAIPSERNGSGGGHGTHVSGIIAGKHYGVAKKAHLVSVQVLDKNGKGTMSNLIAGLDWVAKHAKRGKSVVNLSLGVAKDTPGAKALNQAVDALVKAGIPVIVAAGNSASDACQILPAGNKNVFTVAGVNNQDVMDPNACFGKCVDMFAPGVDVTSDYLNNRHATMSGSSMAAPHVTGIAALALPYVKSKSPTELYKAISKHATEKKIKKLMSNTVNRIAYNKF